MKLRKKIKADAKKIIKGQWSQILIVAFVVLSIIISVNTLNIVISLVFDIKSLTSFLPISQSSPLDISLSSVLLTLLGVVLNFLIITPLLYGVCLWLYMLVNGTPTEISDIFYYFSSAQLFLKSVFSGSITGICSLFYLVILTTPANIIRLIRHALNIRGAVSSPILLLSDILYLGLLFFGIIFYFGITLRFSLVPFLIARNTHIPIKEAIKTSVRATSNHKTEMFFLLASFFVWIILSVLIVPAFFTVAYMGVSVTIYARFLIERYERLGKR
ncbi:MAG: DUF975 family protein [Oscillospiraceae bacterium]|nr:DUF975 family protein [Oscillospiraceae bacterium]